ncbi:Rib/alpha-like domain-containing protein [Dolosigranulum pigrum]|nr:Rib/alpha-like domain-containing protein [Dolosigranulum pigrum]QTJ33479.1 YSIRK-type signal peptide-containing protein [Dolosigranulum pigrum]
MVGKNNKQARWSKSANTFKRYSLKKLSVGVASVVIGTGVAWASSTTVHAAEEGTEVVTGDGEKEAPVESAVPTEAPVVGGDESSSQDAVADLVSQIKAAEEPASEAVDTVEPREANESSDNDYEPIPSDAIEGAAETSDEEKDAGGEDKINEERHTEEVSKEDKDNAEEKLDNEEFQGSFLRSARGRGRGRGRGGSTGTGENSGSATATRDAGSEEPAVEILSASKLPQNPPVFYANEQRGNAVDRDTGLNTVRTTGILAGTFFPEGTKFRLKDNRFTFDKGADAQKEGGNEGQWNRTATIGWFGPSRSGVVGQETNPEKLLTPGIGKKATPFTPHPNNHPYVVRDTGQVLFGLGPSAVKGERINVPMVAEWKDPKTGRTHQWEFFQGIQVGDPKVANRNQKPDNEKDWVFVGETPAENERQSGNVKIGTRDNIVGQNFGWYGQKMGDIGQWIERKNVPKFRPTLADTAEAVEPQYQPVENGGTQSAQPNFVNQDNSSQKVEKPAGTKFAKGDNAPAGATVNPDTGVVSFDKPVDKETTVPVKVTYQDGSSDTTNVVFKPAAKKTNEEVEPSYKRQTITQGEETTTDAPTFDVVATADTTESDPAPEGTTYELGENPNLPEGVKADVDGQTGAVTITSSNKTPVGDFTVPVKVTYSDKSTDNAEVSVTVEKGTNTAEEVEPKYTNPDAGVQTSGEPTFHKQGDENTPAGKPEAGEGQDPTKFEITGENPSGATIDATTGEVTLPNKPTEETTVNVQVTYPDGSTDTTNVTFTPEASPAPKTNEEVEPKYTNPDAGVQTSGEPTFHKQGDENTPAGKPEAGEGQDPTKFEITGENPSGATIDATTGEVTLPNKPTEETTVNVQVTYPDGSTDTTNVTFTPEASPAPKTNEEIEPKYTNPDAGVQTSGAPTFHKQGDENTPAGKPEAGEGQDPTKFEITGENPSGATIDATTGEVTLPNKPTEETTVNVQVTYPDGSTDTTNVTFTPEASPAPKTNEEVEPKYTNPDAGVQTSGEPTFHKQGDENTPAGKPEAGEGQDPTKFEITGENPSGATIDATTGEVTLPNKPIEETTVNVQVTYPDGSTDTTSVTFTPEVSTAPTISGYEDKTITEGRLIEPITPEITNKGEGDITANGLPDGLNINPETGEITGTPDVTDWNDNFNSENPSASEFEDERDFKVTVTVPGQPESIAEFTITVQRDTDGDGTADVNDPDSDGDGINDNVELERGTNPKDANDFKGPELSVNTPKKGEETVSGKTEPQTSVTVKDTDGTVIGQGVSDEEGNFEVPVNRPLKGGEELDVTAGAPDNDKDQTTERVTVDTPDNEEYEPKWEDTNAEDGKRVVVPNTGDEIPAGSTTTATITEDPNNKGKANWTVTVDDNGDVEVTPGSDAQPGDSATVTVETTYPDGTKDSSSFKVTVPTIQSFEYDPQGQDIEVPEDGKPNAADGIANKDELPEGTEFEFDGPVDTSTPGKKKAKVIVAYPDGSTDTVDVTVNVTEVPTQADNHEPKGQDIEVPEGSEPDAENGIANKDELPKGTEFEFDGPVDTSTPGKKKAKVIVAYPDGSTDTVDVTVNVTEVPTQADNHEPKGNPIFVEKNGTPNAADGIANKDKLPEGTEFEFDGPVDTSTPGEKKAKVIVAYPDGSTDTVDVTVNVTDGDTPQSEIFEPQGQDIEVPEGGKPNAADGIANKDELPEGTEFEFDGPVDTSTPGKKKAKVIVAYPDGSTDTVDVTVNVTPKAPGKTTAETLEPKWNDSDAKDGGPVTVPNTGDKIPAGSKTTATITEDPNNKGKANWTVTVGEDGSVTVTPGADAQPGDSATVTVETTYPDGSKDSSSFKVTVPEKGKTTAETLEPKWNDSDAKDGGPVTVPNTGDKIPAGSTTTATITEDPNNKGKANWTVTVGEDGSVTVTPGADAQPGDSATVTVETTYPDGSKDSSSFKVTVPAVGPTHAHGDSLVHDKPSYDLDKLGHGQTQPSRPAEDKAQTPAVDKAGLPNYVPSQSGERLPDTATGAWVLGVVGLMSTGLGSALGLKRKKEDEE